MNYEKVEGPISLDHNVITINLGEQLNIRHGLDGRCLVDIMHKLGCNVVIMTCVCSSSCVFHGRQSVEKKGNPKGNPPIKSTLFLFFKGWGWSGFFLYKKKSIFPLEASGRKLQLTFHTRSLSIQWKATENNLIKSHESVFFQIWMYVLKKRQSYSSDELK